MSAVIDETSLVERYLPIVWNSVDWFLVRHPSADREVLHEAGVAALRRAVGKYDPEFGATFARYALRNINDALRAIVRSEGRT
jgi:DNA-directed RNA polymerase specialized sigma subunit